MLMISKMLYVFPRNKYSQQLLHNSAKIVPLPLRTVISQNFPVPYTQACQHFAHETYKILIYDSLCTGTTIKQIDIPYTPFHSLINEASFVGRPACVKLLNSHTCRADPINYHLHSP